MRRQKTKLFQYLIWSVGLHLLISLLFSWSPRFTPTPEEAPLSFEIVEAPSQRKEKQFVTDPELERLKTSLRRLEDQARFLSRQTQRVPEEQVASRSGKTINQNTQASRPQERPPLEQAFEAGGDLGALRQRQDRQFQVLLEQSAIAEYIPDVKQGGFTSLNTDQFLFYTFYARINEQLRNRWIQNLRTFTQNSSVVALDQLSRRTQITEIEVLLTPDGDYVKSIFYRKADHPGLDQAVRQSFLQAQPFQNPPLEIVDKDGYIHLRYAFHLQWRPRSMASGSP